MRSGPLALMLIAFSGDLRGQTKSEKYAANMVVIVGDLFMAKVTEVKTLSSKHVPMYHVSASSDKFEYLAYCINGYPEAGKAYEVRIDYLDGALSFLKLWPVARKTLNLEEGQSRRGMAYRMLIFRNITTDPKRPPDLACDIKTETAR